MKERRVDIDGVKNIRDVGGLTNTLGETIATGCYYRSATLHDMTAQGEQSADELGIRHIIDLRSTKEVEQYPTPLSEQSNMTIHYIPMLDQMQSRIAAKEMDFPEDMLTVYEILLTEHQKEFAQLFHLLATLDGGIVFHCSVGKDRTGLTAMLLLAVANASVEDIVSDYALSNPSAEDVSQIDAKVPEFLFFAQPEWMEETLDWLDREYGSPIEYLKFIGVSQEELERIRQRLQVTFLSTE